jgi:hypothetical protein
MEKIEKYRTCIEQILNEYGHYKPSYGDVEMQILTDREHDHYQLSMVGWGNRRSASLRLYYAPGYHRYKIWIQHDGTEIGIAKELVALGISKQDIVLGFQPLYKRPHTEYAVS